MNKIVNKFLLAGDKFMPEIHLRQPKLQETKKEYKNLKKEEIHDIFLKTNKIKVVYHMTWLMEVLKI